MAVTAGDIITATLIHICAVLISLVMLSPLYLVFISSNCTLQNCRCVISRYSNERRNVWKGLILVFKILITAVYPSY